MTEYVWPWEVVEVVVVAAPVCPAKKVIAELDAEVDALTAENDSLREQERNLKSLYNLDTALLKGLMSEIKTLQATCSQYKTQNEYLEDQLDCAAEEVADYQTELEDTRGDLDYAERKINILEDQVADLTTDVEYYKNLSQYVYGY